MVIGSLSKIESLIFKRKLFLKKNTPPRPPLSPHHHIYCTVFQAKQDNLRLPTRPYRNFIIKQVDRFVPSSDMNRLFRRLLTHSSQLLKITLESNCEPIRLQVRQRSKNYVESVEEGEVSSISMAQTPQDWQLQIRLAKAITFHSYTLHHHSL
jgi:hypothetical protein